MHALFLLFFPHLFKGRVDEKKAQPVSPWPDPVLLRLLFFQANSKK